MKRNRLPRSVPELAALLLVKKIRTEQIPEELRVNVLWFIEKRAKELRA